MAVDLAGLELEAHSVGGTETCIQVPLYKLAFDLGRCPHTAVLRPTVLFTHAHIDHMGGIAWHAAMRELRGMSPPLYVVPPETRSGVEALFRAWHELDNARLAHRLVPLAPGERFELRRGLSVEPFRSPHRVPTQGYALIATRTRLRLPYRGLSTEEIRRLRSAQGVEVQETVEEIELAFTGDTLIEVVEQSRLVRQARRLVIEATFVDDRVCVAEARRKGHVHLREIAERAELFENEAILLTHFSARYRCQEIVEALDRELPAGLRERVTPLLDGHPH